MGRKLLVLAVPLVRVAAKAAIVILPQLPRNSAETTYTTSPDQTNGMKLEV